ncbi:MAG: BamA/TamA family outer membrane protein [Bacteroidales bacterium]
MNKKSIVNIFIICLSTIFLSMGCSTVKEVPEGKYRLRKNSIQIVNLKDYPDFQKSEVSSYIHQKPNSYFIAGWNPFLNIYNWSNGKGKGWDKFVHKLGQAPVIFDNTLVDNSKENITTHLKYLGFYNSQVIDSLVVYKKKANVFYQVILGKQYPIDKIKYIIKDSTLKAKFIEDLPNSYIKEGEILSESLLDQESSRSAKYFKNQGYFEFSKNYYFFDADTTIVKDSAILTISIRNYTRNENSSDAKPHVQYHMGQITVNPIYDIIRYRASLSQGVSLTLDTLKYKNFQILYDKKLRIRPNVLYNMNRLRTGDLYSADKVNDTYLRYTNLKLFNSINVEMNQRDSGIVDCNIRLLPSKLEGYKVKFEFSTNSNGLIGLSPTLSYYNRNIFRGGEWLNLSFMGNFQFQAKNSDVRATEFGTTAGISLPNFLFLPDRIFGSIVPRTNFNLSYNFQERPEFTRYMIGTSFGYSWNSGNRKWFYKISPLKANIVRMSNVSDEFVDSETDPFIQDMYKNHFDLGEGFTISYYQDPDMDSRESSFKATFSGRTSGNILSLFNSSLATTADNYHKIWGTTYAQYARAELSLVENFKIGREANQDLVFRLKGGIGYPYGNSISIPFEQVFFSGGPNSMRGWSARTLGPGSAKKGSTFSIPNQTGDIQLEVNAEYRFPLFWQLHGAIFFDAGNVWNLKDNVAGGQFTKDFYKTIALNTGVGLRLDMNFVVFRLDWGIRMRDPIEQKWIPLNTYINSDNYSFQFGIGYPF